MKKGFAISGILYPILILTLFLVIQLLMMIQTRKSVLDKVRTELADTVNASNKIYTNEELSVLIDKLNNDFLDKTYPVGSIYISYNNKNPKDLFGGTWVSYGTGRTLVGVDTSQTEFNTVGKTGGAKTHTLTEQELPKVSGSFTLYGSQGETSASLINEVSGVFSGTKSSQTRISRGTALADDRGSYQQAIFKLGGSKSHNNLQPYITVYMWRRTA